jgi:hypothetical protein
MKNFIIAIALLLVLPQFAQAQSQRNPCFTTGALSTNGMLNCVDVGTATPLPTYQGGASYTDISTSTNTVIKSSPGVVQGFTVNTAGTSLVLFDNTACSGTKIGTFTTAAQTSVQINAAFLVGLCATTVGGDVTILWR